MSLEPVSMNQDPGTLSGNPVISKNHSLDSVFNKGRALNTKTPTSLNKMGIFKWSRLSDCLLY